MCHTRVKLAINGPGMSLMAEKKRRQTQRVRMAALTNLASCGRLRLSNSVKPPIAQLAVKHDVSSAGTEGVGGTWFGSVCRFLLLQSCGSGWYQVPTVVLLSD